MSSLILYEDCKTDDLQQLLSYCYQEYNHCAVEYAESACNLEEKIHTLSLAQPAYERIVVFVDVSPGNTDTFNTYVDLGYVQRAAVMPRVFVLPILGAEYYFLLSLFDLGILNDRKLWGVLQGNYSHLEYLRDYAVPNYKRYFPLERFFKYILKDRVYPCIAQKAANNYAAGVFYKFNCEYPIQNDVAFTLMDKSRNYLKQYPVIPFVINESCHTATDSELVAIHRALVNKYNRYVECMRLSCSAKQQESMLHLEYLY